MTDKAQNREIVAALRSRRQGLMDEVSKIDLALKAFGVENVERKTERRKANPETEQEVIRVLTESDDPLPISTIYSLGKFNGKSSGHVYDTIHASNRLEMIPGPGGKRPWLARIIS